MPSSILRSWRSRTTASAIELSITEILGFISFHRLNKHLQLIILLIRTTRELYEAFKKKYPKLDKLGRSYSFLDELPFIPFSRVNRYFIDYFCLVISNRVSFAIMCATTIRRGVSPCTRTARTSATLASSSTRSSTRAPAIPSDRSHFNLSGMVTRSALNMATISLLLSESSLPATPPSSPSSRTTTSRPSSTPSSMRSQRSNTAQVTSHYIDLVCGMLPLANSIFPTGTRRTDLKCAPLLSSFLF